MKKFSTKQMVATAMFAAVIGVLSQISIPMPSGVPVTLQTFAVALAGVILGWKLGTLAVVVYILLGVLGVPVFAGFSGGAASLVSLAGGFIWGFLFLALFCGLGLKMKHKKLGWAPGLIGLAICHLFGVLQFMLLSDIGFLESMIAVSVPYLIKDIVSVILAYMIGLQIRGRLVKAAVLTV